MRREERVTVQGPIKEQQPDGTPHRGGYSRPPRAQNGLKPLGLSGHTINPTHNPLSLISPSSLSFCPACRSFLRSFCVILTSAVRVWRVVSHHEVNLAKTSHVVTPPLHILRGHSHAITQVALSRDHDMVLSAGAVLLCLYPPMTLPVSSLTCSNTSSCLWLVCRCRCLHWGRVVSPRLSGIVNRNEFARHNVATPARLTLERLTTTGGAPPPPPPPRLQ